MKYQMTAKEKAQELIDKFSGYSFNTDMPKGEEVVYVTETFNPYK